MIGTSAQQSSQQLDQQWVTCVVDSDYEIFTEYPYIIRRRSNQRIVSEFSNHKNGYTQLTLNSKKFYKHRVIASQFIPNDQPERKTEVDHIDANKLNNHINNLRWCTRRQNLLNRSSNNGVEYEFIDEDDLPNDLMLVDEYGDHLIESDELIYYYSPSTDLFYLYNGIRYRVMHINYKKNGSAFVKMFTTEEKKIDVHYNKFKKLYYI